MVRRLVSVAALALSGQGLSGCFLVGSLAAGDEDPCNYDSTQVGCPGYEPCAVDGSCEPPPKEPCPSGEGFCRDGSAYRCDGGLLTREGECANTNTECLLVRDGAGRVQGSCTLGLPCPSDGGTACSGDTVYACETGPRSVPRRDCAYYGDHCSEFDGQALCSVEEGERRAPVFARIPGGTFDPTRIDGSIGAATVESFEMMTMEVTLGDFAQCEAAGACTTRDSCVDLYTTLPWLHADLPVTCVGFEQAQAFCRSLGARLPTEVEWEYAARNSGADVSYPWGDDKASCGYAVLMDSGAPGCGRIEPWPGCSQEGDVTEQGACDLVGNVEEWVTVASAQGEVAGRRGGSYMDATASVRAPTSTDGGAASSRRGFRCVRGGGSP